MNTNLEKIVKYIKTSNFNNLSDEIIDKAKICILDIICASAMGQFALSNKIAKKAFFNIFNFGNKEILEDIFVSIWFSKVKTYTPLAIFINSTASTALDIDDGFDPDMGHAGGMVIPTIISACEANNFSTKQAIIAIVVGYNVALAASDYLLTYGEKKFHYNCGSGTHGAIGVAASLANLFNLETDIIAESLRVAQSNMPFNNSYGDFDRTGHGSVERGAMTKEAMNFGALSGYLAFILAKEGYTGLTSFFEYDNIGTDFASKISNNDGLKNAYIKYHASCRWSHFPIEAILKIQKKSKLNLNEIDKIVVNSFWSATRLNNLNPISIESVQYSIPYCIALVLKYGELNYPEIKSLFLDDPQIKHLAEIVSIKEDKRFNLKGQPGKGCEVQIILNNGKILKEIVTGIKGDIDNPASFEDVSHKFLSNCKSFIEGDRMKKIIELIKDFENIKINDLIKILRFDINKN